VGVWHRRVRLVVAREHSVECVLDGKLKCHFKAEGRGLQLKLYLTQVKSFA
jgi:hypothetical protein